MLGSTLSFLGLYNYDPTLFDGLTLPAGVNKDTLIQNLLMETADLEVIYPDANFMKNALTLYGRRQAAVWASLAETFDMEYNPIWNVDGTVTDLETRDLRNSSTSTRSGTGTDTLTRSEDGESTSSSTETSQGVSEDQRAGYNSGTYGNDTRTTTQDTSSGSGNGTASLDVTETRNRTDGGSDSSSGTDTGTVAHETRRTGNIGVTTTQQMLREELDIRPKLNIYAYITEDLKSRFCLLIY